MPFTPGPWNCTNTSYHYHDFRITKPDGLFNYDRETGRANAKLIAAAPDLYEALLYYRTAVENESPIDMTIIDDALKKVQYSDRIRKPMTTIQAEAEYGCEYKPCTCIADGYNCLENQTCSTNCTKCGKRIWFSGDLQDRPDIFDCPYCGETQINQYRK